MAPAGRWGMKFEGLLLKRNLWRIDLEWHLVVLNIHLNLDHPSSQSIAASFRV